MNRRMFLPLFALVLGLAACGDDVASEEDARRAYESLDKSIDKAMQLGFQGFNAASSANIDPQMANGDRTGTITISGKVDQGASDNKTMTLNEVLKDYSDDGEVTYNTSGTGPVLDLKLAGIPNGTITGTLVGAFTMSGALEGSVTLNLTINGELQPTMADPMKIERKPGTTKITGTATSDYGTYEVNLTR
ncbi:hypothetical protein [Polyangium sp. y55x31]|uniref:hypothetical protein n=1 Tax=Polyangium sp. y55x31 TaxID=3042688 RepID=UPI002482AE18|nr:hypothetical protein [Polyangium sp. y55x31]MDI1482864.1 hypothetical protein [Polyangium sp. y55x31]